MYKTSNKPFKYWYRQFKKIKIAPIFLANIDMKSCMHLLYEHYTSSLINSPHVQSNVIYFCLLKIAVLLIGFKLGQFLFKCYLSKVLIYPQPEQHQESIISCNYLVTLMTIYTHFFYKNVLSTDLRQLRTHRGKIGKCSYVLILFPTQNLIR